MILSDTYTWVPTTRIALLSEDVVEKLHNHKNYSHVNITKYQIRYINKWFYEALPGREDLCTEWVLSSMYRHSGRMGSTFEDLRRFEIAAQFYFEHYKEPRFKQVVKDYVENHLYIEGTALEEMKYYNPKNLLDFTLHDMELVIDLYNKPVEDPTVNNLQKKLPEGSKLFYGDANYQIVEASSSEAACDLARGTKWCTSQESMASHYLKDGPLYIIYQKGKKFAQLHFGKDVQLMDLRDRSLRELGGIGSVPDEIRSLLISSGLIDRVISKTSDTKDLSNIFDELFRGHEGELKDICAKHPDPAYYYASYILRKRFPEGEEVIGNDPETAYYYALNVIRGRFIRGEPEILKFKGLTLDYMHLLYDVNQLEGFFEDYPQLETLLPD